MPMNVMDAEEFYSRFAAGEVPGRYLFGINEYADRIANTIAIDGFIDDYTTESHYLGKPIVRLSDVPADAWVVSCVTNARPRTAMARLQTLGIVNALDYFAFADASGGRIGNIDPIEGTRSDYAQHAGQYARVRERLADEASRQVFDDLMAFRLMGRLDAMRRYDYIAERQYFEDFFELRAGEVFVDGGGYDGFTSLEFARRCPDYAAIHFFEPVAASMQMAQARLQGLDRITYHTLGLYDAKTTLAFDAGAGSASRIVDGGSLKIDADCLDDIVHDRPSFIKLDLEGAEMHALRGMQQHIRKSAPKLAIAVYHLPGDFWRIPDYILSLRDDYALHLRHYTEGWSETVAYFIPQAD